MASILVAQVWVNIFDYLASDVYYFVVVEEIADDAVDLGVKVIDVDGSMVTVAAVVFDDDSVVITVA